MMESAASANESSAGSSPSSAIDEEASKERGRVGRVARLIALLKPYRARLFMAIGFLIIGSSIGLVYPQAVRFAVDDGIRGGSLEQLDMIALGLLGLFIFQAGATWMRHYLMSWLGQRVVADLRKLVFRRLLSLPPGWFDERRTGELVGRLSSDVTIVEGVIGSELSIAMRNLVQLAGGLVLLFIEDAKLTLIMLAVVPPLSIAVVLLGRKIRAMSRKVQDRLADTSGRVQEALAAIETVQVFGQEEKENAVYSSKVESALEAALSLAKWRASFMSVSGFAGFLAIGGIVWVGGRAVAQGTMSPGSLTAFMLYTSIVAIALGSLTGIWSSLQRAAGATDRLFDVVDTTPQIRNPSQPSPLPAKHSIDFMEVNFRYATRADHPVLKGISLAVGEGDTVALVGSSGSGKTTIAKLVPRLYDVNEGSVRIGGVDVRELSLEDLRDQIAVVPQDPVLFSGTIAENIGFAADHADQSEVVAAARAANAHDFIEAFPDGYQTEVGERGVTLSGGQRQRVAIARAILADPKILILDEATSSLDAESEAAVQSALDRLMEGRTTLVIAHRLSTVRNANRIVVLEKGSIVEEGDHSELMELDGAYSRLVKRQLSAN